MNPTVIYSAALQAGWGDDERDKGATNPHFNPELYTDYSTATNRNLARVDENRIDFDLLEDVIAYIDESFEEGAILVFLPGEPNTHDKIFLMCHLQRAFMQSKRRKRVQV